WTVDDYDITFAADGVDNVLAGFLAGLNVVGHHCNVGAGCGNIKGGDDDASVTRTFDGGCNGAGINGVQHDDVDARGDEVIDLGNLLVQIIIGGNRSDPYIGVYLAGRVLDALDRC